MAFASSDQLAELRVSRPRERLARDAPSNELHMLHPPAVQLLEQLVRIAQITDVAEPSRVRRVRLHRPRVGVGAHEHRETGILQTEREATSAAEQVDGTGCRCGGHPPSDCVEVAPIRTIAVRREPERLAA